MKLAALLGQWAKLPPRARWGVIVVIGLAALVFGANEVFEWLKAG